MLDLTVKTSQVIKIHELKFKLTQIFLRTINNWKNYYSNCIMLKYSSDLLKKAQNEIKLDFNSLTLNAYLINLWIEFIKNSFANLLNEEAYCYMRDYLVLSKQTLSMKENLKLLILKDCVNRECFDLDFTDLFNFNHNSSLNNQSLQEIRTLMESTMFDLFATYLEIAIVQATGLKMDIKHLIDRGKFNDASIIFAKEKISELEDNLARLNNLQTIFSREHVQNLEHQIKLIYKNIAKNDILHITFGAIEDYLDIFPFRVNLANQYFWYNQPSSIWGDQASNYYGLHIDPAFSIPLKISQCCRRLNLHLNDNLSHNDECLHILSRSKMKKGNFFLFNGGNINLVNRDRSRKISDFHTETTYIEFGMLRLEDFLKMGVIVVLGLHGLNLVGKKELIGPFDLKVILELKQLYPDNLHIIHKAAAEPRVISSTSSSFGSIQKTCSHHKAEIISSNNNGNLQELSSFGYGSFIFVSRDGFELKDNIDFASNDSATFEGGIAKYSQNKCVIS